MMAEPLSGSVCSFNHNKMENVYPLYVPVYSTALKVITLDFQLVYRAHSVKKTVI
jgi:hypothetical protein